MDTGKVKGISFDAFNTACMEMDPDVDLFFRKLFASEQEPSFEQAPAPVEKFTEDEILELISSRSSDWRRRNTAFGQLATIMCDKGLSNGGFQDIFGRFVEPLKSQITERRSTVVKAVSEALGNIAESRRGAMRPFVAELIISLLETVRSNIKTLSNAAKQCCKAIYSNVSERAGELLDGLRAGYRANQQHANAKSAALGYLTLTLDQRGAESRGEAYWNAVMEFISEGIGDANPTVRDAAMDVLAVAELVNLGQAQDVLKGLSAVQHKKYSKLRRKTR